MTLWDEYMAESIAKSTASTPGRMVVLAGAGHVGGRNGIPERFTRRSGEPTFTMVPCCVPWTDSGLPAIEAPFDRREADWILYTQQEIEPQGSGAPREA